jgi:hypothetical protein
MITVVPVIDCCDNDMYIISGDYYGKGAASWSIMEICVVGYSRREDLIEVDKNRGTNRRSAARQGDIYLRARRMRPATRRVPSAAAPPTRAMPMYPSRRNIIVGKPERGNESVPRAAPLSIS